MTTNPSQKLEEIFKTDITFKKLLEELGEISADEALIRYSIYSKNKEAVDRHNQKFAAELVSYSLALNKFSILTPDEIAPNMLALPPLSPSFIQKETRKKRQTETSVDWRSYMQPIQDQKKCGGCWSFAMIAMLEGFLSIREFDPMALSVQQLLDCDRSINPTYNLANQGCAGGYLNVATDYLSKKVLKTADLYPFTGSSANTCRQNTTGIPVISSFDAAYTASDDPTTLEEMNRAMENRVRLGPVAVGFANSDAIYAYGSGIFDGSCGKAINHAVVIVGFAEDFWLIRNSWGPAWGEQGHIRIRRVPGKDPCKLVQYWSTAAPTVKVPSQNHVIEATEATTETVSAEIKEGGSSCEDCDYCGCFDEEEDDWI